MNNDFLNVYGPAFPHATVRIVGTLEALETLKGAIEQAINTAASSSSHFDSIGEQFDLEVVAVCPDSAERMPSPYQW